MKVRRTRGLASGKREKSSVRVNGKRFLSLAEAAEKGAPVTVAVQLSPEFDRCAGPDDASGTSDAKAATSPAARPAHLACAGLAGERTGVEAMPRVLSEREKLQTEFEDLPRGGGELPNDRADFAEAVNTRVDLVTAWERLVRSGDEKVSQRALEKLDEMKYEGSATGNDEQRHVEILVPPRVRNLRAN